MDYSRNNYQYKIGAVYSTTDSFKYIQVNSSEHLIFSFYSDSLNTGLNVTSQFVQILGQFLKYRFLKLYNFCTGGK